MFGSQVLNTSIGPMTLFLVLAVFGIFKGTTIYDTARAASGKSIFNQPAESNIMVNVPDSSTR